MTWALGHRIPPVLDDSFPLPLELPFTAAAASAAGISRRTLTRLVREGLIRRLLKGLYVASHVPDTLLLRAHALSLVAPPGSVLVDWTACWLYTGLLPPGGHLEVPAVSLFRCAGEGRLRNTLCESGERSFDFTDLTTVEGVDVTTPLRTALDLGRLASRDWAIAGMDALLRHGAFEKEHLVHDVERFRRQRGVVQLRGLAPLIDARSESAGESVLRLRWLDLPTLPQPEPQVSIRTPGGRELYRIDLGVEELRFGVEYDGEEHHTSAADREHDRLRRQDLGLRFGWLVKPVRKVNVFGSRRDIERILHEGIREARLRLGQSPAA